jgi:hypothetical protein
MSVSHFNGFVNPNLSFYNNPNLTEYPKYWDKKESCLQDSPPAAGRLERQLPFRRSAILPGRAFNVTGNPNGISCYIKKHWQSLSKSPVLFLLFSHHMLLCDTACYYFSSFS